MVACAVGKERRSRAMSLSIQQPQSSKQRFILSLEKEIAELLDEEACARLRPRYPIVISFAGHTGFNGDTRVTDVF